MAGARKSEKLTLAWKILVDEVKKNPLPGNNPDAWEPLKLLQIRGQMSYGTAGQFLTKFEQAGRLTKHTNGTTRLLFVRLSTLEDLGEDVLGEQKKETSLKPRVSGPKSNNGPKQPAETLPNPKSPTPEDAPIPQNNIADAQIEIEKNDDLKDVVVLCDYENLRRMLERENTSLDFNDLIAHARRYGNVARSVAFIPTHTSPDSQYRLRTSGFRIESCPPRKPVGPDTCDQAIEEFIRFCLKYTGINTFVIVSGDGDFIDTVDEVENNGKRCVLFHYNYTSTSKLLISRTGEAINLAKFARPQKPAQNQPAQKVPVNASISQPAQKDKPPKPAPKDTLLRKHADKLSYNKILEELRCNATSPDESNACWLFLKDIVACLKNTGMASGDPGCRKSLSQLRGEIWQHISGEFGQDMTEEDDCHRALGALRDFSMVKSKTRKHNSKDPDTYYIFDPEHPLVIAVLKS